MSACQTTRKHIESDDYDAAIDYHIKRMRGKKHKKEEHVIGLERAFARAQKRDLARYTHYADKNTAHSWDQAFEVARMIKDRQAIVEPLLPLRSKEGYYAEFEFVDIAKYLNEARLKETELLYAEALTLMTRAQDGDRLAARRAYDIFETIGRKYAHNYRDRQHLMSRALDYGASYIAFSVDDDTDQDIPYRFEQKLSQINTSQIDSRWKKFDTGNSGGHYHYDAVFVLERVEISPEMVRENRYTDECEIQDGFTYMLNRQGNVMKDTAGNDIKVPKKVKVRAEVIEVNQRKTAHVRGVLKIYDTNTKRLLETKPLATDVVFDHLVVNWRGDERALSQRTKCNLGKIPVPFPSNTDLMDTAVEQLKPLTADALRKAQAIL